MLTVLNEINRLVWGIPALLLILGVGIYLSFRTGFVQLKLFRRSLKRFLAPMTSHEDHGGVSGYEALCTALAATVGTGNLAGVAGAIAVGGPGAVFWMWVCALFGMVTKFAEATLAVRYRIKNAAGEYVSGPMYMIRGGLGRQWAWLAPLYCFLGLVASFGVGNATQINTVIGGINSTLTKFGISTSKLLDLLVGAFLALIIAVLFMGGARRIGAVAQKLVPFAAVVYLLLCVFVLTMRYDRIPEAIHSIVLGAFSPSAVTGGVLGSAFQALRVGASRGVFTNEAGMGTAAIAHGSAQVKHPVEQGMMGIVEVFIDTVVICTMTALVILCSGVPISYGCDPGITLTSRAFSSVCGQWVSVVITLSLCLFAVATVLGWGLYGGRCAQFLFGHRVWKWFVAAQVVAVVIGSALGTGTLWTVSEILNGLMAIPNLIALAVLTPELVRLVREYKVLNRK